MIVTSQEHWGTADSANDLTLPYLQGRCRL